jgi:phosphatidyl-myo-inositol alpha-mannosyltransferase
VSVRAPRILLAGPVDTRDGGTTVGGIASHVSDLARALARAGAEVAAYADNAAPSPGPEQTEWGLVFARSPLARDMRSAAELASGAGLGALRRTFAERRRLALLGQTLPPTLANVFGMRAAADAFSPNVLHHHPPDFPPLYARLAGLGNVPDVVTLHSLSRFDEVDRPAIGELVLENVRRAGRVVCVSADLASGLAQLAPDVEVEIVPNGIDMAVFNPGNRRVDRSEQSPGGHPTVLFAGRVCTDKGVPQLVDAVARLRARHPAVRLVLAGPVRGLDPEALAAAAGLPKRALTVLGPVDASRLADLLRASAMLVFPSLAREGQGRTVIEAMATGTPVIASAVGAVPALLAGGSAGLLVPPGDAEALADAMDAVLDDPSAAATRVTRGLELARTFDADMVAERLLGTYRDLLEHAEPS